MKKTFYTKLILFAGVCVLLAFALNAFLDKQMKLLRYDDASVWNDIYAGRAKADVLICGSSRAATHINSEMITARMGFRCYNLGMMGHNFWIEDARYRVYRQHNPKPKMIILSLDYESLQKRTDLFNHTQFIAYLNDSIIRNATSAYEGFGSFDYRLPLLKYAGEQTLIFSLIKNALNPSRNKPDRKQGFYGRDFNWNAEVDAVLDTMKPYVVVPDAPSVARFEAFIKSCDSENIRLVFVHTPTHPRGQEKVLNRTEIISLYQKYAQTNDIPFFDYAADSMGSRKAYFMNSTHLNKVGARVFTEKMIRDIAAAKLWPNATTSRK